MLGMYEPYSSSAVGPICAVWQAYLLGVNDSNLKYVH